MTCIRGGRDVWQSAALGAVFLAAITGCVTHGLRPAGQTHGSGMAHTATVSGAPAAIVHSAMPVASRPKPHGALPGKALPLAFILAEKGVSDFSRAVQRLQALGYLPLSPGLARNGQIWVRHDVFAWPVPSALQRAADRYPWNAWNPFIRSAVVRFERRNGLLDRRGISGGRLRAAVIKTLLSPGARPAARPFEWALVSKSRPETLRIWRGPCAACGEAVRGKGDRWVFKTTVNTGVLGATPDGTWPIDQRLPRTTMRGAFPSPISWRAWHALKQDRFATLPDGTPTIWPARGIVDGHPVRWIPYEDHDIRWVNYFDDGRGIHAYPRAHYGFPQSAGCVEASYSAAVTAYRLLHYGVPVTISGRARPIATVADGSTRPSNEHHDRTGDKP